MKNDRNIQARERILRRRNIKKFKNSSTYTDSKRKDIPDNQPIVQVQSLSKDAKKNQTPEFLEFIKTIKDIRDSLIKLEMDFFYNHDRKFYNFEHIKFDIENCKTKFSKEIDRFNEISKLELTTLFFELKNFIAFDKGNIINHNSIIDRESGANLNFLEEDILFNLQLKTSCNLLIQKLFKKNSDNGILIDVNFGIENTYYILYLAQRVYSLHKERAEDLEFYDFIEKCLAKFKFSTREKISGINPKLFFYKIYLYMLVQDSESEYRNRIEKEALSLFETKENFKAIKSVKETVNFEKNKIIELSSRSIYINSYLRNLNLLLDTIDITQQRQKAIKSFCENAWEMLSSIKYIKMENFFALDNEIKSNTFRYILEAIINCSLEVLKYYDKFQAALGVNNINEFREYNKKTLNICLEYKQEILLWNSLCSKLVEMLIEINKDNFSKVKNSQNFSTKITWFKDFLVLKSCNEEIFSLTFSEETQQIILECSGRLVATEDMIQLIEMKCKRAEESEKHYNELLEMYKKFNREAIKTVHSDNNKQLANPELIVNNFIDDNKDSIKTTKPKKRPKINNVNNKDNFVNKFFKAFDLLNNGNVNEAIKGYQGAYESAKSKNNELWMLRCNSAIVDCYQRQALETYNILPDINGGRRFIDIDKDENYFNEIFKYSDNAKVKVREIKDKTEKKINDLKKVFTKENLEEIKNYSELVVCSNIIEKELDKIITDSQVYVRKQIDELARRKERSSNRVLENRDYSERPKYNNRQCQDFYRNKLKELDIKHKEIIKINSELRSVINNLNVSDYTQLIDENNNSTPEVHTVVGDNINQHKTIGFAHEINVLSKPSEDGNGTWVSRIGNKDFSGTWVDKGNNISNVNNKHSIV